MSPSIALRRVLTMSAYILLLTSHCGVPRLLDVLEAPSCTAEVEVLPYCWMLMMVHVHAFPRAHTNARAACTQINTEVNKRCGGAARLFGADAVL